MEGRGLTPSPSYAGEAERRSFLRLPFYLSDAAWHGDPGSAIRRPGVLAGDQTVIEGAFSVVAHRHGAFANAASTSGATVARGRQS